MKTLIRNVIVNNKNTDILIDGSKVVEVGENLLNNANKVIDGKECFAINGNCNCYFDGDIEDCKSLPSQGVTSVFDFANNREVTKTLVEMGLKVFTAVGDFDGNNVLDEEYLGTVVKEVIDLGVVAPIIYLANPNIEDESQYAEVIKYGKKHNYLIATSVSEYLEDVGDIDNQYGMSPIALLESYGFLDYKNLLIGCVYADKEDVNILTSYDNTTICTCPTKNLVNGSGIAPIYSFYKNHINVVVGGNTSNMFSELNLVKNLQSGNLNEKDILKTEDVEPFICKNVKAIFDQIGSLKKGDYADIVLVNNANIEKCTPHNVVMAFVNGKQIY